MRFWRSRAPTCLSEFSGIASVLPPPTEGPEPSTSFGRPTSVGNRLAGPKSWSTDQRASAQIPRPPNLTQAYPVDFHGRQEGKPSAKSEPERERERERERVWFDMKQ